MKTRFLTITAYLFGALMLSGLASKSFAQSYTESFDDITLLAGNGWLIQNNSTPVGSISWFQGTATTATPTPGPFNSYTGAANSYIGVNFNSTGSTGTISNWLVTPNRTLRNGDVFTFYTRKPTIGAGQTDYPDRLEVRLSTNGASTNVGSGATGLGDFTTLLLSINPTLVANVYPQTWTQYTITVSGLPAPTSGRIAFRYFVTGAGSLGTNSDYIGIDQVVYTPYVCPAFTMTAAGALTGATAGSAYSNSLTQTGALGAPSYAVTGGAVPPGVTLSASGTFSGTPTATGTFNFTVTVSDASGCSGSQSYSITVVCPANPVTFSTAPTLCDNAADYTLIQGSPAGGTYSGTGVTAGAFDPSSGTQTITYNITDPYGCPHSSNYTITVNTAPTVTQSAFAATCDNVSTVALTGGSPAGGTYSGTGVTGTNFAPSAGTQPLTYTYTDANNCTSSATATITVNTAPAVAQSAFAATCDNNAPITLTGGSPAGGTYSGTGVTAGAFDPSSGTQPITYTYTDANNCTSSATATITVNAAPTASQSAIAAVCADAGPVVLTGGSPAGGTYSGTGVTGTNFNPASGTQVITYTYTDGNGCTDAATTTITVNALPAVTFTSPVTTLCENHSPLTLSGGSPVGGTYSGTGVSGGVLNPATAGAGNHAILYSYTDGNGCQEDATFTIVVDDCLGLNENGQDFGLAIYPNPTNGKFTMNTQSGVDFSIVNVVDVQGKEVRFESSQISAQTIEVDFSNQVNGVYFVKGLIDGQHVVLRVQKY